MKKKLCWASKVMIFSAITVTVGVTYLNISQKLAQDKKIKQIQEDCNALYQHKKKLRKSIVVEILPSPPLDLTYTIIINEVAKRYNVDADLIRAIIKAESNYNPKAHSPVGAKGLMQLMPATAKSMGVSDVYDPLDNIVGGTKLMSILLTVYKNKIPMALAAYNAGERKVNKYGKIPPYKETQQYVQKVLRFYLEYKNNV